MDFEGIMLLKAKPKRSSRIGFPSHHITETTQWGTNLGCGRGMGMGGWVWLSRARGGFLWWWNCISIPIPCLWYYTVVLQDVTTGGHWIKDMLDLSVSFLTIVNLQLFQNQKFVKALLHTYLCLPKIFLGTFPLKNILFISNDLLL